MAKSKAADGDGVGFHNLGFQSRNEANAWLELHAPKNQFGFIVDFHTTPTNHRDGLFGCFREVI